MVLCSGASADAKVPGGIFVREAWASENEETVKKVLAAWMKATKFINDPKNRDEVLAGITDFNAGFNITLSTASMEREIDSRPLYDLQGQLDIMDRGSSGVSTLDVSFVAYVQFHYCKLCCLLKSCRLTQQILLFYPSRDGSMALPSSCSRVASSQPGQPPSGHSLLR